jgi:modulator of FtsH protease
VHSYDPAEWHDLFVAVAGAAAALAGLLFVALSINLKQILAAPMLAMRAAAALATLILAVIAAILILVPGQHRAVLGTELLVCAAPTWLFMTRAQLRLGRSEQQTAVQFGTDLALAQLAMIPVVVAGASLAAGAGGGLYWMVPALVFVFVSTTTRAWVLLVEVNR